MKWIFLIVIMCACNFVIAQEEVVIGTNSIILPRTVDSDEIEGSVRYNPTTKEFQGYNGSEWVRFNSESKERELVLSNLNFVPSSGSQVIRNNSYTYINGAPGTMLQGFHLPAGATITAFLVSVYDNDTDTDMNIELFRQSNEINSTSAGIVASLFTSGTNSQFQTISDTDIMAAFEADIAAENDVYFVDISAVMASNQGFNTSWPLSNLRIKQVVIRYTVE